MGSKNIFTHDSKSKIGTTAAFCAYLLVSSFFFSWCTTHDPVNSVFQSVKEAIRWAEGDFESKYLILSDSLSGLLVFLKFDNNNH